MAEFRQRISLVHRLKQREKEQKYSKAQAAAKRRAAEALQQQKDSRSGASWFSRVAQSLGVRDLGAMAARCSAALTAPLELHNPAQQLSSRRPLVGILVC